MDRHDKFTTFESILTHAWSLLEHGAKDDTAAMHYPVLATRGLDDLPNARTVLLWRAERAHRLLHFGTDRRSPKHAELARTPWALLVFYEPAAQTQLRLHTTISFRSKDPLTLKAWRDLPIRTRRVFATPVPPGHAAPIPSTVPSPAATRDDDSLDEAGYRNFELLEAKIVHLDWLYMPESGHRRAAFTWKSDDATPQATWLYP